MNLNTVTTAEVNENIHSIDGIMKAKAERFKDIRRNTPLSTVSESPVRSTTINIGNITIKNKNHQSTVQPGSVE